MEQIKEIQTNQTKNWMKLRETNESGNKRALINRKNVSN